MSSYFGVNEITMPFVKVAVNGYGVIGKRVVSAVQVQKDMELVGISDVVADWRVKMAASKKIPIYCSMPERAEEMKRGGIEISGFLDDLLSQVDVVVDCAPAKIGIKNKTAYEGANVKGIFQGGEKHEVAGTSFVAQCKTLEG